MALKKEKINRDMRLTTHRNKKNVVNTANKDWWRINRSCLADKVDGHTINFNLGTEHVFNAVSFTLAENAGEEKRKNVKLNIACCTWFHREKGYVKNFKICKLHKLQWKERVSTIVPHANLTQIVNVLCM